MIIKPVITTIDLIYLTKQILKSYKPPSINYVNF